MAKKIVVLGAGYAGLLIAKKLEKKLKKTDTEAEITLIDKNPFFTMLTELHEVAAWRVDESSIRIDLQKVFAGRDVNVVQDNIVTVDQENNRLLGKENIYNYDYLVFATGCKPAFYGVEGAEQNSFTLWSYDDAVRLREHIMNCFKQAYVETNPEKIKELLTFYVVGGGFTGVEMAGELAEFVPHVCEKFNIDPKMVQIINLDILDRLMPFLPEKLSEKAARRLEKMGVTVKMSTRVTRVGENEIHLEVNNETVVLPTSTIIWTAGTEGSDLAMNTPELGHAEHSRGRIQTDKYLRSLTHPNVYIAGDNLFFIPEGKKEAVPQMVENAEACAPVIVENIVSEVAGGKPTANYAPKFHGVMVCIGGRYGLAHVGTEKRKFTLPSFFAMFAKHFINIILFLEILGWNKSYSYMRTEFFTIRNKRSFVGGHFSNRGPAFMVVPLRMFMGIFFIYNAFIRFSAGWLSGSLHLRDIFYDAAARFRPTVPGMELFDINLFERIHFAFVVDRGQMTMLLQTSAANWFFRDVVFASHGMEMFAQWVVVLFMFLIGLALLGGLFTGLASVGAIAVAAVFIMTTGLPFYMWWLPFGALACMFVGGRVLSLDYYVLPWLGKHWKERKFVKKWYLYNN